MKLFAAQYSERTGFLNRFQQVRNNSHNSLVDSQQISLFKRKNLSSMLFLFIHIHQLPDVLFKNKSVDGKDRLLVLLNTSILEFDSLQNLFDKMLF